MYVPALSRVLYKRADVYASSAEAQAGSLPTSDVSSNPDEWAEFVCCTSLAPLKLWLMTLCIAPPTRREILRLQQSS